MSDFHRTDVNDRSFVRGAARLLVAPIAQAKPTKISDVIRLASGSGPPAFALYDPASGWSDLGATKTGIQITMNNAEESFDVDQIMGDISSAPTSWECSVGTQLAEMTPERMQVAWEGSAITTAVVADSPTGSEQEIGFGQPVSYTQRRLAVVFQRPNGKIRAYFFHKVQRMPQESSITHAKTGEQISIPVRFRVLADSSVADIYKRFFIIRDQSIPTNP
jgi:hypothetical protein